MYPLEESHAGHLMLPCSDFARASGNNENTQTKKQGPTATLLAETADADDKKKKGYAAGRGVADRAAGIRQEAKKGEAASASQARF
eukprot:1184312-Prorocentrum_lima.AAC.1